MEATLSKEEVIDLFIEDGYAGELLDDIHYCDTLEEAVNTWQFRIDELRKYIIKAEQIGLDIKLTN